MIKPKTFDGPCYDPALDCKRLTTQLGKVYHLMISGGWYTLSEISYAIKEPEASISAQLRHLKKERFGSYVVNKQRRGDPHRGLWEYRLLPPLKKQTQTQRQKEFSYGTR